MNDFFEKTKEVDVLRKLEQPNGRDLQRVMEIIRGDKELTRYFYDKNERGALGMGWLELLDGAGEFKELERKEGRIVERVKALYLVDCASIKPKVVLSIVKKVEARDPWIQGKMLEAILAMPEDESVHGISVVMKYLGERDYKVWYFTGEPAAKLMVKLFDKQIQEALGIAKALLDVWRPGEKEAGVFETIRSKFATHEYKELMFEYYSNVWEKQPFEATRLLVDIYDKYLEECIKEKDYDTSEYLGVSVEDLEDIQRLEYDLDAIIMKAICESGRTVIKNEPKKVSELLEDLEKRNKGIFHRVEMYLLRFVQEGTEKERINNIIGNQKFIENPLYKYEHRRLLNEKFGEVGEEARKAFIEWIKKKKITEERKKEVEEWCQKNSKPLPDFEKWENQRKGEELYLVRDKFSDLYEGYKNKSGLSDGALAPGRMVSEAHFVSPEEGSQYSSEKMGKDNVEIVVNYLLEPKNYEGKDKVSGWGTAKDALAASFKTDVKKRSMEYLKVDFRKLERLDPEFLEELLYGVSEAVRDGIFKKDGWERLIDLAGEIVATKNKEKEWRDCFLAILWVLRDGFGEESNRIAFDETIIRKFWFVLKDLVGYNYDEKLESEEDPVQRRCRSIQGGAFKEVVLLGIACKKDFATVFENFLRKEMGEVYKFVAKEVKRSEVNCTFGFDFARIYWLDKEWVESNIESIFNEKMWDAVWGTYVSWGRPSPKGFELLKKKGKYGQAVDLLGTPNKYEFGKKPEEGLVEHLMIGYFNGWVNLNDELLKKFFEKATAKLRGKAARFLTTGFKSMNEEGGEEKEKVATRMTTYWEKRIATMREKPEENIEEAVEFTGWVKDTLLGPKETLELLEKTLDLSGGKFGQMRDVREFIGRICELGKGNELIALRCLKKATADENMRVSWARYEERLKEFLEQISKLPNEYENVEDVLNEAVEVADLYGRIQPDKFREIWEKLNKRLRESKV